MKKYLFTEQEKNAVKEAVQSLEKESCGEIVPFFARKSDDYVEVCWQFAALFGVMGLGITGLLSYLWLLPNLSIMVISSFVLMLMLLGYFLPLFFPIIKRMFVSSDKMMEMVSLRAKEAFINEKVFETDERIGILIYISRLEHLVLVMGDEGINKKVKQEDWEKVVALTVDGLKSNKIGDGLVSAIDHCKELLLSHGFVRKDSDYNELSDDLRIQE